MRRTCAYSLDFHLLVQETSPIHPGQPSASSASTDSSSSSTAARKEKEPEQEHQQEQQQKPKEEAASHTSTQTDAHADTTPNDPWHGLDFMHAPLPPSTDTFDFPPQTTAKGLPGSKFTYVSAIVWVERQRPGPRQTQRQRGFRIHTRHCTISGSSHARRLGAAAKSVGTR